ncbi:hypothetical protein [Helicobacter sp. MIT 05-5294]|uniref:hypothetical protein n=1 Tax=Helicobacter sp. MIT 05-5294 TaxID=1548150 RepID=UPI00051F8AF2|nr:hypothetical protein [Helicobacter sp. MIT 05-5294]TLD86326.1 hypothetical protein LS69_006440 [Helicobacter sp. MIT 05-5294]
MQNSSPQTTHPNYLNLTPQKQHSENLFRKCFGYNSNLLKIFGFRKLARDSDRISSLHLAFDIWLFGFPNSKSLQKSKYQGFPK